MVSVLQHLPNLRRTRSAIATVSLAAALTGTLCSSASSVAASDGSTNSQGGKLPLVYVLSMGGTIAGRGASSTSGSNYERGAVTGDELVTRVPELRQLADLRVEQIVNLYGNDLTIDHWLTLAKRINTIYASDPHVAGVVVGATHPTPSLTLARYASCPPSRFFIRIYNRASSPFTHLLRAA